MARVFVTRRLPGAALDRLGAEHDVDLWPEDEPPPDDVLCERAAEADAILTMLTDRVDASLLESAPSLRAVSNLAVGTDNVDVEAATERGIPVGHTPDVLTEATADLAFALLLAAARRLRDGDAFVREGRWRTWDPNAFIGRDLAGTTLGIVGLGRIGRAVARRAEGFGMEVIHSGGGDGGLMLGELLDRADHVTVHAPLTPKTRKLIGEPELRRMKETAVLVNTARGPLVDTDALARALTEGWIAAAGLDVTDPEPLAPDHPLLRAPNLTIVPHVGSATHRTREAMADIAVDNVLAALRGEPMPHCVNPEVYDQRAG